MQSRQLARNVAKEEGLNSVMFTAISLSKDLLQRFLKLQVQPSVHRRCVGRMTQRLVVALERQQYQDEVGRSQLMGLLLLAASYAHCRRQLYHAARLIFYTHFPFRIRHFVEN
jgi:hypothetical protein